MTKLLIKNLTKKFGDFTAVDDFSLSINEGDFVALVGPSGCGKTTTLRCVAGFIPIDQGEISLGDQIISDNKVMLPPEKRNMAMVFQSYAVWPHKTVFKNVSFGLELRKMPKSEIRKRVMESLELTKLSGLEKRYPNALSGGQQQRVALARGLVVEPEILLLDEPLSNLDATLREEMRFDLREIQQKLKITSIYVTHDQAEAMVIADRIVVMKSGKIEQIGGATDIYHSPDSSFVANFVGTTNVLNGEVKSTEPGAFTLKTGEKFLLNIQLEPEVQAPGVGENVAVSIRPESIVIENQKIEKPTNIYEGTVSGKTFLGSFYDYRINIHDQSFRVQTTSHKEFEIGARIWVYIDPAYCKFVKN